MLLKMPQPKKILFFIAGHFPTAAEQAAADKLGTRMFRNAAAVDPSDSIENAVGYAGLVPASYVAATKAKDAKAKLYVTEEEPAKTDEPPPPPVENGDSPEAEPEAEPAKKKKKK